MGSFDNEDNSFGSFLHDGRTNPMSNGMNDDDAFDDLEDFEDLEDDVNNDDYNDVNDLDEENEDAFDDEEQQ